MANRNEQHALAAVLLIAVCAVGVPAAADPLTLQIDPASGLTLLKNETQQTVDLTSYRLASATGALNVAGWNPISNGNELPAQFPPDNGIDDGTDWEVALNPTASELVEWYVTGASQLHAGQQLNLGNAVIPTATPALEFTYTRADETLITGIVRYETIAFPLTGDYNNNGVVDAADYVVWRKTNINGQPGYDDWRANFGRAAAPEGAALGTAASVPEPTSNGLVVVAILCTLARRVSEG